MPNEKKATPKEMAQKDAIAMLKADHRLVEDLFEEFEKAKSDTQKTSIVSQICKELIVHMQLEEEIFYPAVKAALNDHDLVPEGVVEHTSVKDLIAEVKDKAPYGEMYDAKVKVMNELVEHHVKEEEEEMFVKALETKLDLKALGAEMANRKEELMAAGK